MRDGRKYSKCKSTADPSLVVVVCVPSVTSRPTLLAFSLAACPSTRRRGCWKDGYLISSPRPVGCLAGELIGGLGSRRCEKGGGNGKGGGEEGGGREGGCRGVNGREGGGEDGRCREGGCRGVNGGHDVGKPVRQAR